VSLANWLSWLRRRNDEVDFFAQYAALPPKYSLQCHIFGQIGIDTLNRPSHKGRLSGHRLYRGKTEKSKSNTWRVTAMIDRAS
jgi:hypothetical protein